MKHLSIPLFASFLLPGPGLMAQTPPLTDVVFSELEALLNTPIQVASSKAEGVFSTPSTVSVIDRAMIERYGFRSVAEAVETVAGVAVQRSIFHRDMPTIRGVLQESYANRVLLLIDGISTWHAMTGDAFLFKVDIEDVQRIEILKGPASVLYGTNAYAGAINIVTRKRGKEGSRIHAGMFDQGGYRAGASRNAVWDGGTLFLSATINKIPGENLTVNGEGGSRFSLQDVDRTRVAQLALEHGPHSLYGNVFENVTPFFGAIPNLATGGGRDWEENGLIMNYTYDKSFGKKISFKYSITYDQGKRYPFISQDGARSLHQKGDRLTQVLQGHWEVGSGLGIEGGLSHEKRRNAYYTIFNEITGAMVSETGMKDRRQTEQSAFLQADWGSGPWRVLLGSRYTRNDAFGSNLSSRVTAVYTLSSSSSLKFIAGQSFRAPDFLAQYFQFATTKGNLNLKPEKSDSIELAYLKSFGNVFIQALAFHQSFKDKVNRVREYPKYSPIPSNIVIYENVGAFSAKGVELELKYEGAQHWNTFLNLDYITGTKGDEDSSIGPGYNYKFVPRWGASGGLSKGWGAFTGSLLVNHQTATDGPIASVPSWTSVNLSASYTQNFGKARLRYSAALKNAADQERWFPEFVRRFINALPEATGRQASAAVAVTF